MKNESIEIKNYLRNISSNINITNKDIIKLIEIKKL